MSVEEMRPPPKSAAPGQYLGFSLQQLRLCYHLLLVPNGASVSLEYVDDVAVHLADGSLVLEQSKSALSSNPVSDHAVDLWKSFANWADCCVGGIDPTITNFVLYVTPDRTGSFVKELHAAQSSKEVATVLAKVKTLVNPKTPNGGWAQHVTRFIEAGDSVCSQIIKNFSLVTESDPLESIKKQLRAVLPPETLDDFCSIAIGMARDRADSLIRQGMLAVIPVEEFRSQFRAFVQKHNLAGLLTSKAPVPPTGVITALVDTAPTFVLQLEAVEASPEMLVTAVCDYLRSESDKVEWANDGIILADSLNELDAKLIRQHTILRDEIEDTGASQTEEQRGRALYRACTRTQLPLDGRDLPSHFISGVFNYLADLRKLGWHPQYKKLFPIN